MFNIGSGEIALIAVVALLILGPSRLPELARGIGKFMREFRRQTDEVRGVVEREFYKMDAELKLPEAPLQVRPASDAVAKGQHADDLMALPTDHVHSQLTAGAPSSTPVEPAPSTSLGVTGEATIASGPNPHSPSGPGVEGPVAAPSTPDVTPKS